MESGLKEMSLRGSLRTAKIVSRKKEAVPSSVLAGVITKDFFFFSRIKCLGSLFLCYDVLLNTSVVENPHSTILQLGPFLKQAVRMHP